MTACELQLHAAIDAEYRQMVDCSESIFHAIVIFDLWRAEKEYLDTYGCRMPVIDNIDSPNY
jgi:hypothetical protein